MKEPSYENKSEVQALLDELELAPAKAVMKLLGNTDWLWHMLNLIHLLDDRQQSLKLNPGKPRQQSRHFLYTLKTQISQLVEFYQANSQLVSSLKEKMNGIINKATELKVLLPPLRSTFNYITPDEIDILVEQLHNTIETPRSAIAQTNHLEMVSAATKILNQIRVIALQREQLLIGLSQVLFPPADEEGEVFTIAEALADVPNNLHLAFIVLRFLLSNNSERYLAFATEIGAFVSENVHTQQDHFLYFLLRPYLDEDPRKHETDQKHLWEATSLLERQAAQEAFKYVVEQIYRPVIGPLKEKLEQIKVEPLPLVDAWLATEESLETDSRTEEDFRKLSPDSIQRLSAYFTEGSFLEAISQQWDLTAMNPNTPSLQQRYLAWKPHRFIDPMRAQSLAIGIANEQKEEFFQVATSYFINNLFGDGVYPSLVDAWHSAILVLHPVSRLSKYGVRSEQELVNENLELLHTDLDKSVNDKIYDSKIMEIHDKALQDILFRGKETESLDLKHLNYFKGRESLMYFSIKMLDLISDIHLQSGTIFAETLISNEDLLKEFSLEKLAHIIEKLDAFLHTQEIKIKIRNHPDINDFVHHTIVDTRKKLEAAKEKVMRLIASKTV